MIYSENERENRLNGERLTVENHLQIDSRMNEWSPYGLNLTGGVYPPHQFIEICFRYDLSDQIPVEVRLMYERAKAILSYGIYHYPLITVACDYLYRMMEAAVYHFLVLNHSGPIPKKPTFFKMLKICEEEGYVDPIMLGRWQATRKLRNFASHKKTENINWANSGLTSLGTTKELLEALYVYGPPNLVRFYQVRKEDEKISSEIAKRSGLK